MDSRYERVYEVGLLDDLHNYFPGLLYEPDRFRSVTDVLTYIRQNTARRFNLFDYGSRQHLQRQQNTRIPQNTYTRQPPVVNRWTPSIPVTTRPAEMEFDLSSDADLSILFPLLRSLDRLAGLAPAPLTQPTQRAHGANRFSGIFQDIIVHASQELIDSGSNLRTLLMDLDESCSICQDRMRQGENIRRLNACQHEFHGACVDNWFLQRSVFCPVCRHDIRDTNPVLRSPILGSVPNTMAHTQAIPPLVPNNLSDDESPDISPRLRSRS